MPKRIQRKRTKGWRMPEGAVYVGRPTVWGNPHDWQTWREDCPQDVVGWEGVGFRDRWCRERAQQAFAEDLRDGTLKLPLAELKGKDLACWCPPGDACHADVLLEIANH